MTIAAAGMEVGVGSWVFAKPELARDLRQRCVLDQRRAQATQVSFVRILAKSEYRFGNHEVQDGVAEKLESLIIPPAGTAMRESLLEQARISKSVIQRFVEPALGFLQCNRSLLPDRMRPAYRRISARLSKSTTNETLAMNGAL